MTTNPHPSVQPSPSSTSSPAESGAVERADAELPNALRDLAASWRRRADRASEPNGAGFKVCAGQLEQVAAALEDEAGLAARDPQVSQPIRADLKSNVGELVTALEPFVRIVEALGVGTGYPEGVQKHVRLVNDFGTVLDSLSAEDFRRAATTLAKIDAALAAEGSEEQGSAPSPLRPEKEEG